MAAFSPWLISGRNLAPFDIVTEMLLPWRGESLTPKVHNHFVTDAVTQYIPYRMFAERSFREDGFIGWNPNVFSGAAQYANTMGLYFDWSMQLHRWLDFWQAWHLGLLGQFAIAGWGMLFFLRSLGCSAPISLMGAAAYMLNTQFVVWVYHRWALSGFCWIPWVLLAISTWQRGAGWRWAALASAFLAMGFMGGSLQHAAMMVVAVVCLWGGELLDQLPDRRAPDWLRCQAFGLLGFAGIGLLSVALSGWMWEATVSAYFENSAAGHERAAIGYPGGVIAPVLQALSLPLNLFPTIAGSPQTLDLFKLFKSDVFNAAFFGTIPGLLALTAFFLPRIPAAPKLLIAAGLLIPLSPLVGIFYHRVNVLWIAGGIWAAAGLLRIASPCFLQLWAKWAIRALVVLGAVWLLASAAIWIQLQPHSEMLAGMVHAQGPRGMFGLFAQWVASRASGLPGFLLIWNPPQILSFVGGIMSLSGLWALAWNRRPWLAWLLPLGVSMQLLVFWSLWTTWSSESNPYAKAPLVKEILENKANGRLVTIGYNGQLPTLPFFPNVLDPLDVAFVGGYHSIHPNGMNAALPLDLAFPGVGLALHPSDFPVPGDWTRVAESGGVVLSAGPRAHLADNPNSNEIIPVKRPSANRMELEISDSSGGVRIFENFHPGWSAQGPAGQMAKLECAEDGSMLLNASAPGKWILHFSPSPPPWVWLLVGAGLLVTLLCLVLNPRDSLHCSPRNEAAQDVDV